MSTIAPSYNLLDNTFIQYTKWKIFPTLLLLIASCPETTNSHFKKLHNPECISFSKVCLGPLTYALSSFLFSVVITAMDMEAMTNTIRGWVENPVKFARSHGVVVPPVSEATDPDQQIHILIVEGFLLYNYK